MTWPSEPESKPGADQAIQRIYVWYEQQVVDWPPVCFTGHNAEFDAADSHWKETWRGQKGKGFDEDCQISSYLAQRQGKRFLGETFPIFWPNLGPNVFASFYGCPPEFGEVTSWAESVLEAYSDTLALDWQNEYLHKLDDFIRPTPKHCPREDPVARSAVLAVVMFGLGGIYTEVLRDISLRVALVERPEAAAMLREVRAFPILKGVRGQPGCDLGALAETSVNCPACSSFTLKWPRLT